MSLLSCLFQMPFADIPFFYFGKQRFLEFLLSLLQLTWSHKWRRIWILRRISDNGDNISFSLPQIYDVLAIWIRIYGDLRMPSGVKKGSRPLRFQFHWYATDFAAKFHYIPTAGGIRFIEHLTTHFSFDSRYSKRLSHNFRSVLRGIGRTITGKEKLLHFTGMTTYLSCCS